MENEADWHASGSTMSPPPYRHSTRLTLRLMQEICLSVDVFRPSASLYELSLATKQADNNPTGITYLETRPGAHREFNGGDINLTDTRPAPTEIDLVVSGGKHIDLF